MITPTCHWVVKKVQRRSKCQNHRPKHLGFQKPSRYRNPIAAAMIVTFFPRLLQLLEEFAMAQLLEQVTNSSINKLSLFILKTIFAHLFSFVYYLMWDKSLSRRLLPVAFPQSRSITQHRLTIAFICFVHVVYVLRRSRSLRTRRSRPKKTLSLIHPRSIAMQSQQFCFIYFSAYRAPITKSPWRSRKSRKIASAIRRSVISIF